MISLEKRKNITGVFSLLILLGYKFATLEMKSIISAVLRKCRLEPILGKEKVIAKFRMTVRAHGGLWVKVRSRDERCKS